jgi:cation:H+ antiporter
MVLLIKGADYFVDGASSIARALKIPTLIIGLTLVSLGTTLPESSVSIMTALQGSSDMSLGNVVGSNIFNTLPILGIGALICPIAINKEAKNLYIPILCGLYVLLIMFAFVITPYSLDRWEGIILILLLIGYLTLVVLRALSSSKKMLDGQDTEDEEAVKPIWLSLILVVIGVAGIVFGADLVVDNAVIFAKAVGMSEKLVGLTILSVGTSLPELITGIVAAVKKENDIALGNIVGACTLNIIFILGVCSTIVPLAVASAVLIDLLVMLATGLVLLIIVFTSKKLNKWHAISMLAMYVAYLVYIIMRG